MSGYVVGYTFNAENLCPTHTISALRAAGIKVTSGRQHEDAIRRAAEKVGVDFSDEGSYDSGDFPKTITRDQVLTEITERPDVSSAVISDERCDQCGKWLIEGERSPNERTMAKIIAEEYDLPKALAESVRTELRRWGYTHPAHIDSDDVQLAARRVPHDYVTVRFAPGYPAVRKSLEFSTPQEDGDTCLHCDGLFEDHRFRCTTCKEIVGAVEVHRHQLRMPGQRAIPMRTRKGARS